MRSWLQNWRRWLGPLVVVLVGFGVRAAYYTENYGHPDETITTEVVGYMRASGDWDTNWAKANLEPGFKYDQYNFSSHLYGTFFFYRAVKLVPGLERWRSAEGGRWVYRFFSVLLATIAVALTWWLARKTGGDRAGLLAGGLVAVAPLLVQDAHYMRPEAFVTALTLVAVGLAWPDKKLRPGRVLAAGAVVGLLVACKVSMLALIWLPLVPVVMRWRGPAGGREVWIGAGLAGLGLVAGFVVGAPGAVAHPGVFWHGVGYLAKQYAGLHPPHSHLGGGKVYGMLGGYFWSTLGGFAVVAGCWGAAVLWRRRDAAAVVLVAGPVALFAGYFATRSVFFERNLSHVVPLFCVLAGVGVAAVAERMAGGHRRAAAGAVGLLGLALVARPAELMHRLVWTDFSQRGPQRHAEYQGALQMRYGREEWRVEELMNAEPIERLEAYFKAGGAPVIVRVQDYHDEWTAAHLPLFRERLDAELVGHYTSLFADVPGCTLHTYNGWTDHYFRVRGVKNR